MRRLVQSRSEVTCFILVALLSAPLRIHSLLEGDECVYKSGAAGRCRAVADCPSAIHALQNTCSFQSNVAMVCCVEAGRRDFGIESLPNPARDTHEELRQSGESVGNGRRKHSIASAPSEEQNTGRYYNGMRPEYVSQEQPGRNQRPYQDSTYLTSSVAPEFNRKDDWYYERGTTTKRTTSNYNRKPTQTTQRNWGNAQVWQNGRPKQSTPTTRRYETNWRPEPTTTTRRYDSNWRPEPTTTTRRYDSNWRPEPTTTTRRYETQWRPEPTTTNRWPHQTTTSTRRWTTTTRSSWTTEKPYKPKPGKPKPTADKRKISEIKCSEYSRRVTDTAVALPLTTDPKPLKIDFASCLYPQQLIVGGENTTLGEFPHMAAIGFNDPNTGDISWDCGGSLISEKFVMTAAHCASKSREPILVRLGDLNLIRNDDGAKPLEFSIKRVIRHPGYKPPAKYHDIALLELAKKVPEHQHIRPACLYTSNTFQTSKAIATGWGQIAHAEARSNTLLKVVLNIIDSHTCNNTYKHDMRTETLSHGIIDKMLCAGELKGGKDTCQGDSGGPIEVISRNNECVHHIIGVTSFGKSCAMANAPGVYTRVSAYVPWIESIVWPTY